MPKRLPTYSLHRATGQARVWLGEKDHYLSEYGSEESRVRYGQLVAQYASGDAIDPISQQGPNDTGLTIHELVVAYREFAKGYYCKNGRVTAEFHCIVTAVRPMLEIYGSSPAKTFGPAALKICRQRMIDGGTMGVLSKWMSARQRLLKGDSPRHWRPATQGLEPASVIEIAARRTQPSSVYHVSCKTGSTLQIAVIGVMAIDSPHQP